MSIITYYSTGAYRASEESVVCMDSSARPGLNPVIIAYHGRGADCTQFSPLYWNGLWLTMQALCEAGYIVISIDGGASLTSWGNADSMTAIGNAITWAQATTSLENDHPQGKAGDVGLLGWSMGGLACANYQVRNEAQIAGSFLFAPTLNLDYFYDGSYTAEIETAYGGNYAVNSVGYDPYLRMTDYNDGPPIYILHSDDDPTVPIAHSQSFDSGTSVTTLNTVTGYGHFPFLAPSTPQLAVDFFKGVLPV